MAAALTEVEVMPGVYLVKQDKKNTTRAEDGAPASPATTSSTLSTIVKATLDEALRAVQITPGTKDLQNHIVIISEIARLKKTIQMLLSSNEELQTFAQEDDSLYKDIEENIAIISQQEVRIRALHMLSAGDTVESIMVQLEADVSQNAEPEQDAMWL